jgi:hypothetical protein
MARRLVVSDRPPTSSKGSARLVRPPFARSGTNFRRWAWQRPLLSLTFFLSLRSSHKFLSLLRVCVRRRDPSIASTTVCNDELTRASSVKSTANDAVHCPAPGAPSKSKKTRGKWIGDDDRRSRRGTRGAPCTPSRQGSAGVFYSGGCCCCWCCCPVVWPVHFYNYALCASLARAKTLQERVVLPPIGDTPTCLDSYGIFPKQHFYEVSNLRGLLYVISSSWAIYAVTFVFTFAPFDVAVQ